MTNWIVSHTRTMSFTVHSQIKARDRSEAIEKVKAGAAAEDESENFEAIISEENHKAKKGLWWEE